MEHAPNLAQAIRKIQKGEAPIRGADNPYAPKLTEKQRICVALLANEFGFTQQVIAAKFGMNRKSVGRIVKAGSPVQRKLTQMMAEKPIDRIIREYVKDEDYEGCMEIHKRGVDDKTKVTPAQVRRGSPSIRHVTLPASTGGVPVDVVVRAISIPETHTYGMDVRREGGTTPAQVWGYSVDTKVFGAGIDVDDLKANADNVFICRRANPTADLDPDIIRTGALFRSGEEAMEDAIATFRLEERYGPQKR